VSESLKVDIGQLSELASALDSGSSGISTQLANLDAQVQQLLQLWSGDAQQSYALAQAAASGSLERMRQLLHLIAVAAQEVAEQYGASDRTVAEQFV